MGRGRVPWIGQPCQFPSRGVATRPGGKAEPDQQPSTKSASFNWEKTKSDLPMSFDPLRQPQMPCARKIAISRSSVALLPRERMAAITAERLRLEKMSGMS